ncbi:MAG: 23S rRNA (uracil(1939)-C(5))-methyltransferase RlmD [Bacteroidota bacterium]
MKRGAELEITIEKFADRGKSLSRVGGYVVFVAGAVPGDRIRARVFKRKKKFAEAQLLEVVTPSPLRTDPRCSYHATCGGCKWQHVDYAAQCEAKRQSVQEALTYQANLPDVVVNPTLGSEHIYFYRNKMEFSFSAHRWLTKDEIATGQKLDTAFALGLHVPGNFYKVIDLQECYLQSPLSINLVNAIRRFAQEQGWAPWNIRDHEGYLRHLVIRQAAHTEDVMVNLVTSRQDATRMALFAEWLQTTFPAVTTAINTVNDTPGQTAFGAYMEVLYGPGTIRDRLGRFTFEVASNAFFQTNTRQAERLYEVTRSLAALQPSDLLYDLYCGAGTISLYMSDAVHRVVGAELVEEAVVNARANAVTNGVTNCTFVSGDLKRLFTPDFVTTQGSPDVVITDPPRAGMHPKVVAQLAALRPERLIYVSCNPQTQARDLTALTDLYTVEAVQPVDLFPHTHHIENVVALRRRPS